MQISIDLKKKMALLKYINSSGVQVCIERKALLVLEKMCKNSLIFIPFFIASKIYESHFHSKKSSLRLQANNFVLVLLKSKYYVIGGFIWIVLFTFHTNIKCVIWFNIVVVPEKICEKKWKIWLSLSTFSQLSISEKNFLVHIIFTIIFRAFPNLWNILNLLHVRKSPV